MDRQLPPDLGASSTTFSWVADLETDPNKFISVEQAPNDATYSMADDVSMSGRSEGNLRLYVRLPNGARILIPIPRTATVDELHTEAVRRVARLDGTTSSQNSVLETTGPNASILFGEDTISDVLDTTENLTFLLNPLDVSLRQAAFSSAVQTPTQTVPSAETSTPAVLSTSSLPIQISGSPWSTNTLGGETSTVYIRWITTRAAMDAPYLKNIPVESYQVDGNISVAVLKSMAFDQVYGKYNIGKQDLPEGIELELFLTHCYISGASGNTLNIADLAPEGSNQKEPINIFISSVRKPENTANFQGNWGFECTRRSVATFMTSLEVMMHEITKGRVKLDCLLEVLWSITHFPPALLAFKQLYDSVLPSSGKLNTSETRALSVLVEAFKEVAQKMVPPWISNSPDTLLESSRQLFAWLHTLSTQAALSNEGSLNLVHEVELQDVTGREKIDEIVPRYKCKELVDISSADGVARKRFFVSLSSFSHIAPKILAGTLNGAEEYPCNYYFYLPDNSAGLHGHKRASCLHPSDFDNLLETTNQVSGFKMIGPLQLANTTSSNLPIVTLDSSGLVSTYNQKVELCADGSYYTWNAVTGREEMKGTNPGQYLLQKLNPLMEQRKKDKNWEVDAWTEAGATNDMGNPDEAIVICVDASGSMGAEMAAGWMENQGASNPGSNLVQNQISRITEVKELFRHLVSRISAYNLPTHLGLVTFSSSNRVHIAQPLTPVLLNFQHRLDGTSAGGATAVFDALLKAKTMLVDLRAKHPSMKCRIIVLTDGEDNSSTIYPANICRELYFADIVVDAIIIGTDTTLDLFKIAKHTGGYAFCPKTRSALFQIFLLETFIDIKTRPDLVKPALVDYYSSLPKPADMQTTYDFPPCRPHPNQQDHFISLRDADRFLTNLSRGTSNAPGYAASESTARSGSTWTNVNTNVTGTTMGASGAGRLILNEVKSMIENQHEYIDVYVSETNMGFWKVVMQGPPASPYEDGAFLLYIEFGDQFPRKAPTARFITPILHPNITKHGRICHPIFDREWTPVTRVYQVIQQIWGIFMSLEARDAVDPLFTLKFWTDPETGRREVKQYVDRFAKPTRATHRTAILSGVSSNSTPSVASSKPPSYRTTASTPPAPNLTTHMFNLRGSAANSSVGSGAPILTPAVSTSSSCMSGSQPRRSSRLSSSAGLVPGANDDASSISSSSASGRRRRFFSRLHGR